MPGLSQLVQFNKDIISLGNEITLRAQRGEKPVRVSIPKTIQDVNDSEEFVLGMPENEAIVQDTSVDEDLSDLTEITGTGNQSSSSSNGEEQPSNAFEAPDLSALLAPMADASGDESEGMPDLSMFMEPEEPDPAEIEVPEPEEPSIADLSLEDLLGGAGFDGSSAIPEEENVKASEISLEDEEFYSGGFGDENYTPKKKDPEPSFDITDDLASDSGAALSLAELGLGDLEAEPEAVPEEIPGSPDTSFLEDLGEPEELSSEMENLDESPLEDIPEISDIEEFDAPDIEEIPEVETEPEAEVETVTDTESEAEPLEDFSSALDGMDFSDLADETTAEEPASDTEMAEEAPSEFESIDDLGAIGGTDDLGDINDIEDFDAGNLDAEPVTQGSGMDFSAEPSTDGLETDLTEGFGSDFSAASGLDSLSDTDMPDFDAIPDITDISDIGNIPSMDLPEDIPATETESLDISGDLGAESASGAEEIPDFDTPDGLFDAGDIDLDSPSMDLDSPAADFDSETGAEAASGEFDTGNFDTGDFDTGDFGSGEPDSGTSLPDFNLDDMDAMDSPAASSDLPDFGSADMGDGDIGSMDFGETEGGEESIETFDTSEIEGLDFSIPDTDAQISGEKSDFELGNDSDFGIEGQDFEIPGFSDVETAKEEKHGPLLVSSSDSKKDGEELPPNTLSDAQYKKFLKNLNEYPLNVRLAFEDLIVKNEFTDDAEFEIVEKILNKASARQVASLLEKMLDISIPVPRDYEHRTAEEYEAYKKSLQYQLKNKIIPGIFACMVFLVVGFGLFQFGKNCIYIPAKANHLYKQGYAMLEADEYPQSEIKFTEATTYRLNKKWFFKYARGYRAHKQYIRAEWMYQNILNYFKHNKEAGLEYANMELYDLANYEKAEEVCRRQILDFHVNDADGILLLGDTYLEWGTEKDPEKLEAAREQYATLIQLYKSNNLYQSRMMRYFIRTDNLRYVLSLKEQFLPKEKNLSAEDWTELSGYMLDKLYGPLAPADEYLRSEIEDVRLMLIRAVKLGPSNPVATYNLARYFIETNESRPAIETLKTTIENFKKTDILKRRELYKYIDTYRLAGEQYKEIQEYLRAQEFYTEGISLYTTERDASGLPGNKKIGVLFADQADIDYFISGDFDNALRNYISSVELENDNPSIRYKIGYIQYKKKNYAEALGSFMKAGDGNIKETNLMLAMGNTLSIRGDNYAAQGYYEDLISKLDTQIAEKGLVLPQAGQEDHDLVTTYLYAANNYGVTLYRLASRTGNSSFNAQAIVQLSQSVRAWDALTRNQVTMERLGGSNLAEENIRYITHPVPEFEPSIYTEIPRTIVNNEKISN